MGLEYVFTGFENASPLDWWVDAAGTVHVALIYDRERCSPNRAVLHWHLQLQGTPGSEVSLLLHNFDNIWNGKPGSPLREETSCAVSVDGRAWNVVRGRKTPENLLHLQLRLATGRLYVARVEPYRLSDLDRFLAHVQEHPMVAVQTIGRTVEGRPLEMLRVGAPDAGHHLLLRARSHPWETGGNWVLEGLVQAMLEAPPGFCLHAMPMANKDGVARGGSRFNLMGRDLNRNWDVPADTRLAPENAALEEWLEQQRGEGRLPRLAIDLHNDSGGRLHVSRPEGDCSGYLDRMGLLEEVLRRHTWFTEGSTGSTFRNPGSIGEGLLTRFGIDACILELNADWAAGLGKAPLGQDWVLLGRQMRTAFQAWFDALPRRMATKTL